MLSLPSTVLQRRAIEDEKKDSKVVSRSVWKDPFVDAFLMKKKNAALNKKIWWSRRSTILPKYVDSSVRIYNGKKLMCVVRSLRGKFVFTRKGNGESFIGNKYVL
ncbi:unnamed protein product [Eruca vesicaria subsp. sativa]|uniref:Ribosomal protein S19 n=1 Tax=Eruca vesicaria subsp. sativa TaxID=29727 RepID=A0ABC8LNX2_ERUVS|nr:unnamed protein product [Eruca vesicaria subsp. sativa]